MTRRFLCKRAWRRAKARLERVFPPPVGTVRVKMPGGSSALSRQFCSTSARFLFTAVSSASLLIFSSRWARRLSISASDINFSRASVFSGDINASVFRKSASTRQEKSIRTQSAKRPGMSPGFSARIACISGSGQSGFRKSGGISARKASASSFLASCWPRRTSRPPNQSSSPA